MRLRLGSVTVGCCGDGTCCNLINNLGYPPPGFFGQKQILSDMVGTLGRYAQDDKRIPERERKMADPNAASEPDQ
jgi:hypothetical protein